MGLSNGFGAAAGAAGGPPASHGTTHQPNGTDPLGPLAGQSFDSVTEPVFKIDGSVWVPSGTGDVLRGEWLVWHSWRNSGSGRWLGHIFEIAFGSDAADGTFLELVRTGPSADIAYVCRKDMVILGVAAARSNDGPTSKTIDLVIDGNIGSPTYQFNASRGTTFSSAELDYPINAGQLLGVRATATGEACRIAVQVKVAARRD